jgi:transcriptional regulator with XRE-family HTH domain
MKAGAQPREGPNHIDGHVGARIRMRRKGMGISQERLAGRLGLTFQQVQKYEQGTNRVSASKLYEIARTLQAPIAYFFEGLDETTSSGGSELLAPDCMRDLVMTREGLALAMYFCQLRHGAVRRQVLALVRTLIEVSGGSSLAGAKGTESGGSRVAHG